MEMESEEIFEEITGAKQATGVKEEAQAEEVEKETEQDGELDEGQSGQEEGAEQGAERVEGEEVLSEEEIEVAREIEAYSKKIEELDAKLDEAKEKELLELRRDAMFRRGYSEDQVDRYVKHIKGENAEEINLSVGYFSHDIPPRAHYIDPTPMNGAKQRPKAVDPAEYGRKVFERIKDKIRWG